MQDYKNIRVDESLPSPVSASMAIALLDQTDQDVPCSTVYVERTENMRGVEKDSLSSKYRFPG